MTRRWSGMLACVLLLSTSCLDTPAGEPRTVPARTVAAEGPILLLGDSIMHGAAGIGDLVGMLEEAGFEPEVLAELSKTVPWGIEQVEQRALVAEVVVVGLGTNPGSALREFPAEVDALVDALTARGAQRILWVPPVDADPERYVEKHQALLAAEGGPLIVLAWPAEAAAHPEWFGTDGLHLTTDGYIGLATFIASRVA